MDSRGRRCTWRPRHQPVALLGVDSDQNASSPPSGQVQSVDRAITILEFLASNEWSGVTEVGKEIGVHKSTAFRLLSTLENRGLVEQHLESGKYRLGFGLVNLANSVMHGPIVTRQAQPACQWLARHVDETVTLAIVETDEAVTIDQIASTSTVASRSWLGRRMPMHATAQGKVFLAFLPPDESAHLASDPLEYFTPNTIVDADKLGVELDRVRGQGYATTCDEFEDGLSAIAAPICAANGDVVASIGLSGPSYRLDREQLTQLAPLVREAASRGSVGYGYAQLENNVADAADISND